MPKALSIKQPYVTMLLEGLISCWPYPKDPGHRGQVYLHAGARQCYSRSRLLRDKYYPRRVLPFSAVVGSAQLIDVTSWEQAFQQLSAEQRFILAGLDGAICFMFKNVRPIGPHPKVGKNYFFSWDMPRLTRKKTPYEKDFKRHARGWTIEDEINLLT